jgi:hypothetical protein
MLAFKVWGKHDYFNVLFLKFWTNSQLWTPIFYVMCILGLLFKLIMIDHIIIYIF